MGRHPSRRHVQPGDPSVGTRVRQRRRDLDLTQADLAGPHYTKSFISQLEGGYADPSLDTLRFLARRLHLALSTIAGDTVDQQLATAAGLLAWAREHGRGDRGDAARQAVTLAHELARAAGSALYALEAALLLAEIEAVAGRPDAAAAALAEAAVLAGSLGTRATMQVDLAAGWLALRRGELLEARAAFRRALARVRKVTRHPDLSVRAMLGLGAVALEAGDARQAQRRLESAVSAARRGRLPGLAGRGLVRLAFLAARERRRDDADVYLAEAATLVEDAGDAAARAEVARARAALDEDAGPGAPAGSPPWPLDVLA
jgi:transcriptional regulator with XRE-family HTH domain